MRRTSLALVLSLWGGAASQALAQGIGIKGGLSYGNVSNGGALPGDNKQRSGFAVGLGANTGGVLGFGIEALFAQRGVTSSTVGDSRELNYIDVPVYLKLSIPNPVISPFAYAGPQGSYELNCNGGGGNCPDTGRPKITSSAVIGAGVRLPAVGGLSLEGRYVYGLTNLNLSTVTTSQNYQTRSFLILLGLGF
jgi:hypothetical protein